MRIASAAGSSTDVTDRAARLLGLATEAREVGNNGAGNLAAPAINTILATTGALANPGIYRVVVVFTTDTATNQLTYQVQHRNAADAATIVAFGLAALGNVLATFTFYVTIAANERVRVTNILAGVGNVQATLSWERIS